MSSRRIIKKRGKDEAEKPFWISFSDLMTAMMVMFLVVMAVALLAITSPGDAHEKIKNEWKEQLKSLIHERFKDVEFDESRNIINFGSKATFDTNSWDLNVDQSVVLRKFTPELLDLANNELGKKVVKRIVVEGFADSRGYYLNNLNLSLLRSERVLCVLLSSSGPALLSNDQKRAVQDLFLVGGYSFNNVKTSLEASRRIEMRIEFLSPTELRPSTPKQAEPGNCPI